MPSVRPLFRLRAHVAAVVLLVAALLALPALAGAQSTKAGSLAARTADALERSPVVVSPPFDTVIDADAERGLVRKIEATDQPILMAFVPLVEGDQFGGDSRAFVAALQDRLGRDATIVAVESNRYLRLYDYRGGEQRYGGPADDAMELANYGGDPATYTERTLLERADLFLDNLALPAAELEQRVAALRAAQEKRNQRFADERDDRDGGSALLKVLLFGGAGALGALILMRRRRNRSGARPASSPLPVLPDRVFEHARAAQRANLREDADDELMKLSKVLDDQPVPTQAAAQDAYQRALDAYGSARRRTGPDAPTVDLVGALVLVDHARHDLATASAIDAGRKPPERTALCMFDPLHGRAARTVRWEHRKRTLDVPACQACAQAVNRGSDPDALRDGDRPYFERDSVWARTGFGTLDDDLVERVSRGER